MALNKAQKLVKIVELMTRRGGVRASELGERFDLDTRTLRRYLSDIKGLGLPLHDEGRADDRVLALDARWRRTGVNLSLAEVLSLHFGRTLFNFLDGTSFASDLDGAIERLEPAISRTHQDLARQLDTKFIAVAEGFKQYGGDASDVIDDLISALVYNNPIEARYRKAKNMVEGRYTLHPYTLATYKQGLYLFALDLHAGQVKTFAVERFVDVARSRDTFDQPVGWSPAIHLANAFGIIGGQAEEVVLAFDNAVATYVRERTWSPTQTFRTLPDGRLELRLRVAASVELVNWTLQFGPEVEVLGPPSLRARVAERLRRAAERYP